MQFTTLITLASAACAAVLGVSAEAQGQTTFLPTATVTETNTYTATRVEEVWFTTPPYVTTTTFPISWTAVETKTLYETIVNPLSRRHPRDLPTAA